ncbi:MAG: histidine ammonia-lyase [Clostridia bacterium]
MITLDGNNLTIEEVVAVARNFEKVKLSEKAIENVNKSRLLVENYLESNEVMYGITTGFGKFSDVVIDEENVCQLQHNLIMSHACAVGKPLDIEVVRAMMLIRVNSLIRGNSGIRLKIINLLVKMLNKRLHPVIPSQGSLGASGDLAPLASMVLPIIGLGKAEYLGEIFEKENGLKQIGEKPYRLAAKEGLALINGTQVMTAIASLLVYDAKSLINIATKATALTIEALQGIPLAFDEKVHFSRNHLGQIEIAKKLRNQLEGSKLTTKQAELRVQDAYSLRCSPQVLGASLDSINYVEKVVTNEINASTDNPLIFYDEKEVISAGNFHGQPIALAMDFLKIALSEIANISERRIERIVNPQLNNNLPAFLAKNAGLNSGYMIAQYTAASLVSENKVLAHPASVDSIPSSANQEDHVSMGTTAARQALEIYKNVAYVVAIEFMVAAQAIETLGSKLLGKNTKVTYNNIRKYVDPLEDDRVVNTDIEVLLDAIRNQKI